MLTRILSTLTLALAVAIANAAAPSCYQYVVSWASRDGYATGPAGQATAERACQALAMDAIGWTGTTPVGYGYVQEAAATWTAYQTYGRCALVITIMRVNGDNRGTSASYNTLSGEIRRGSVLACPTPPGPSASEVENVGHPPCAAGNPIDAASGNKYQEEIDYVSSGPAPLRLIRYYNSGRAGPNPATMAGYNWRTNFSAAIQVSPSGSTAHAFRPDGRAIAFTLQGGVFTPEANVADRLVRLTSGSVLTGWTYKVCATDELETYDALGQLISISDRAGRTQTLAYDTNGRLATVTGPFGQQLQMSYTDGGFLQVVTDPAGGQITYEYDGLDSAYPAEVLADSPQGYWRLQEAAGSIAESALPGGVSGTYGGTYSLGHAARGGRAVRVDDAGDGQVHLGTNTNYTNAFTLEIWVNPNSSQPDGGRHIFTKNSYHATTHSDFPVRLGYTAVDGFYVLLSKGNDASYDATLKSGPLPSERWYHVVAVYRKNGQCELWVNGSMVASQTINFTVSSNSRPWKLGNGTEYGGGGNAGGFSGVLSDAALYSSALSASRIQAHYAAMPGGNLSRVEYPDGTARIYHYEDSALTNHLTGISYEDTGGTASRYATFAYDSAGKGISTEHAGGAEHVGLSYISDTETLVTNAFGDQDLLTFAANLGVMTLVSRTNVGSGATVLQTLDANNNVVSRTDYNGNVTCYAYDAARNLEIVRVEGFAPGNVCPAGLASYVPTGGTRQRKISTTWHATFSIPVQITEAGRAIVFTHDSYGNVLTRTVTDGATLQARTWTYTYDANGQVLTENGPRTDVTDVTTYTYYNCTTGYECGQIQSVTDAAGHVTTFYNYNEHGQPTHIEDPNGVITKLAFDLRQRPTAQCVNGTLPVCTGGELTLLEYWPTGLLKKVTLPGGDFTEYAYDAAHRLTQVSDSAGNSVTYTLDAMGNRTAEHVRDSLSALRRTHSLVYSTLNRLHQTVNASSTGGATTTYGYDNNGNLTSVSAPLGRNSSNLYDELNRLRQITDPASGVTVIAYDEHDNVAAVTDPKGQTTGYTYNGFGDLLVQASPDTGTTTNTYDSAGNVATSTDARGATATFDYDALNRVIGVTHTLTGSPTQALTFEYDQGVNGKGQLTRVTDADHAMSWAYDEQGRVNGKGVTVGAVTLGTGYGYIDGRLVAQTLPSGNQLFYTYDAAGRVASISVGGTTIVTNVTWEPFGPARGWTWGNSEAHSRDHDQDGRVASLATSTPNGINLGFGYDAASRITSRTDTGTNPVSWTYGYDDMDRLTSAAGPQAQGWTYDANGNRLAETGANPTTYTVSSASNRLDVTTGVLNRVYSYDAVGNALTDGALALTYNARNRLATALKGGGARSYVYDGLGQLILASGTGGAVRYMYDEQGHLIGEYDGAGALIQETVWLGDIPVATIRPGSSGGISVLYVHTDQLYTPRKLTDPSSNATVWRWDSDAFGIGTPSQDPDGDSVHVVYNLRFPGQVYDDVTGLNYNYFRDYDPVTGRYVQSDPIGLDDGPNTYAYVENDPTGYFDADGLSKRGRGGPPRSTATARVPALLTRIRQFDPSFQYPTARPKWMRYDQRDVLALELALKQAMQRAAQQASCPRWPSSPSEMNQFLGVPGRRVPDGAATPGRNKWEWQPNSSTTITFEQHPYDANAPAFHRLPHWHLGTPAGRHDRYVPGDPMPGFSIP